MSAAVARSDMNVTDCLLFEVAILQLHSWLCHALWFPPSPDECQGSCPFRCDFWRDVWVIAKPMSASDVGMLVVVEDPACQLREAFT